MAKRRCWWCGQLAEVDTELPVSGGMVRDSDTSWVCLDGKACSERAYAAMLEPGYRRNIGRPS